MKLFINLLIITIVVSTISICAIKPEMHKSVIVFNSDYKLVPETVETIEKEDIKIMEVPVTPTTETVKKEVKTIKEPKTVTSAKTVVKTPVTKTTVQQKPVQTQKTVTPTPVKQETKTTVTPVKQEQKTVQETAPVQTTVQSQTHVQHKVLTQEEEEIAWNVWRSNLQNKIMQDVKLPILPYGVVFKFSFTVDKYGRVTNVVTYSTNSSYTPYAIQYIAPVIRSYQGKSILNFPEGSARTITDVKGGWKISGNERYSTPQDYNDTEKVIR